MYEYYSKILRKQIILLVVAYIA